MRSARRVVLKSPDSGRLAKRTPSPHQATPGSEPTIQNYHSGESRPELLRFGKCRHHSNRYQSITVSFDFLLPSPSTAPSPGDLRLTGFGPGFGVEHAVAAAAAEVGAV